MSKNRLICLSLVGCALSTSAKAADFRKMKVGKQNITLSGLWKCFVQDRGWTYRYGNFYANLVLSQKASADTTDLIQAGRYSEAEAFYRPLLPFDATGDSYAALAVALAMQVNGCRITEAERILSEACKKGFSDNPKVLAATGCVYHVAAEIAGSISKQDLYYEASSRFCKRALKLDPTNKIALETLRRIEFELLHPEEARVESLLKVSPNIVEDYRNSHGDFGSNALFFVPGQGLSKHGPVPLYEARPLRK